MSTYRSLSQQEQSQLAAQGNLAQDWNRILITDATDLSRIQRSYFYGEVRIGAVSQGDAFPEEGIVDCVVVDSTIGDHCRLFGVRLLQHYRIGNNVLLFNVGEMLAGGEIKPLEVMNENGGRAILPFPGMTTGQAYLWARYRGRRRLQERLVQFAKSQTENPLGYIGDGAEIRNTKAIRNVYVDSALDNPTRIADVQLLENGVMEPGCVVESGVIAERFVLGEHVHLEMGLRLNDTVVGANSTLARCEVGNSIIFPSHEQHHNNSFLIASLIMGQSNLAAGATIGSNHNGRTADNELVAGRGFWPGLCSSLKHSSMFASYSLLAKADYPYELNITLPFSLVNNNVAKNQLEVMPAYWWLYNMYSLNRNNTKFAKRDKRVLKTQHIEFDILAPDTAEEILIARALIREWTSEAYLKSRNEGMQKPVVLAHGMEHSKRPVVVLKAAEGYKAYEQMLVHYAVSVLSKAYNGALPPENLGEGERIRKWVNIGGQIVSQPDMERLIADVENGSLSSWEEIRRRMDDLWESYPRQKQQHAYKVLCFLAESKTLTEDLWQKFLYQESQISTYIQQQIVATRHKDEVNPFRQMTYWDQDECEAVLG